MNIEDELIRAFTQAIANAVPEIDPDIPWVNTRSPQTRGFYIKWGRVAAGRSICCVHVYYDTEIVRQRLPDFYQIARILGSCGAEGLGGVELFASFGVDLVDGTAENQAARFCDVHHEYRVRFTEPTPS